MHPTLTLTAPRHTHLPSYVWWIWAFDLFVLCLLAAGALLRRGPGGRPTPRARPAPTAASAGALCPADHTPAAAAAARLPPPARPQA